MAYIAGTDIQIADDQSKLFSNYTQDMVMNFKTSHDHSQYIMMSLPNRYTGELLYYQLPVSLKIYRQGSLTKSANDFYFNIIDATSDGKSEVHGYTVIDGDNKLMGLDRIFNITILKAKAFLMKEYDVINALDQIFTIVSADSSGVTSRLVRDCDHKHSKTILKFLHSLGYDGYIAAPGRECPAQIYLYGELDKILS